MKINKYLNFINEEAPYNLEIGADISNRSSDEWSPSEIKDLNDLGADEISKNTAIFKQGSFNVNIKKNSKLPFYIATSDVPLNIKRSKRSKNNISDNLWNNFLKKLDSFIRKNGDNSIEIICKKYKIKNWTLNPDGTVDVYDNVNLEDKGLDKIPLNFGNVHGKFNCSYNNLTSLVGCPKRVGGYFDCDKNNLTSLEGCPTYIGGRFWCQQNKNLWSMDHFPRHAKIVWLIGTPINTVFYLFRTVYLADGGEFFSTSGTLMDFFWDCDPVWPGRIIKKKRLKNFLSSIGKKLKDDDIRILKNDGWKIQD